MLHETNLLGLSTTQLEQLHTTLALNYFADDVTEQDRDILDIMINNIKTCQPHSFVLASLFDDVEAMTLEIPEHVYESDPLLEWVTCPECDGERWLDTGHNHWTKALFSDPRMAYAHRHLNSSYKACGRCSGVGEILDSPTYEKYESYESWSDAGVGLKHPKHPETPTVDVLIARVEDLLAAYHTNQVSILADALNGRR